MSIELVMPSNHLILCCPLLLPPSIFPHIRVFSNESVPRIRWPKYWSFNFNINPSNEYSGLDLNPVLASGTHSKSVDSMNGLIFSDHFLSGRHSSKLGHFILIKSMTVLWGAQWLFQVTYCLGQSCNSNLGSLTPEPMGSFPTQRPLLCDPAP